MRLITFGDGDVEASRGSQGGGEGTLNLIQVRYRGDTEWRTLATKDLVEDVPAGSEYLQHAGGGGGWGDPRLRPVDKVLRDVRNGVVSLPAARDHYGVVIDTAAWTVDHAETARLRGSGPDTVSGPDTGG